MRFAQIFFGAWAGAVAIIGLAATIVLCYHGHWYEGTWAAVICGLSTAAFCLFTTEN